MFRLKFSILLSLIHVTYLVHCQDDIYDVLHPNPNHEIASPKGKAHVVGVYPSEKALREKASFALGSDRRFVHITSASGNRFTCSIPAILSWAETSTFTEDEYVDENIMPASGESGDSDGSDEEQTQSSQNAHIERVKTLRARILSIYSNECLLYPAGYWTYSMCFFEAVRQSHREGKKGTSAAAVGLGTFKSDTLQIDSVTGKQSYAQIFSGGDGNRNTEVQFKCVSGAAKGVASILAVEESPVLHYKIRVHLPELCDASKPKIPAGDILSYLAPLKERPCLTFQKDYWWTFEFCYLESVLQYHEDMKKLPDGSVERSRPAEFTLGRAPSDPKEATRLGANHASPRNSFVQQMYGGGDKCDLTGKPRTINVVFRCQKHDLGSFDSVASITAVNEIETCQYEMYIATSLLCDHPAFAFEEQIPDLVACYPTRTDTTKE
eukprot:168725_1